jgi:hypothetical protein
MEYHVTLPLLLCQKGKQHLIMETQTMERNFSVQSVLIDSPAEKVFNFIAEPSNLPKWTNAFKNADHKSALLVTPAGEMKIGLETKASNETGTIDWYMKMPDGSIGKAYSRVVEDSDGKSIYSFILLAPPVPIEKLEGTLKEQEGILSKELRNLKRILE